MLVHIDRDSRIPIHEQITDQLRILILSGGLVAGHRFPSSCELAEFLSINRKTVVQAHRLLRAESLVRGNERGGTVVRSVEEASELSDSTRPVSWKRMYTESTKPSYISPDRFYREWLKNTPTEDVGAGSEVRLHCIGDKSLLLDAWRDVMHSADSSGLTTSPVR